jgi:phage tail tape-measure protein
MCNRNLLAIAVALCAVLLLGGCAGQPLTEREKGTGVGALLGAGTGAIIGAAVGSPGAGAAIGGGLGAATGFVVGNEFQNLKVMAERNRHVLRSQERELAAQRAEIRRLRSSSAEAE